MRVLDRMRKGGFELPEPAATTDPECEAIIQGRTSLAST